MKIVTIAALAAIAVNGKTSFLQDNTKAQLPDLISDELVAEGNKADLDPVYTVTEKGQKLIALLEASSDYFEAHQEIKKGATEAYEAVKEETGKILTEAKKTFNSFLDSIKMS